MKNLIPIFLFICLMIMCACQDEFCNQNQGVVPNVSLIEEDAEITDTLIVNPQELHRAIEYYSSLYGSAKGRSDMSYNVTSLYDKDGSPIIYVVNLSNNSGFYVLSAKKDAEPLLAYNTTGSFPVEDAEYSGISTWLNDIKYYVVHISEVAPDNVAANRMSWSGFEYNNLHSQEVNSRAMNPSEKDRLIEIKMNTMGRWMGQNKTFYEAQELRTRHPDIAQELINYAQNAGIWMDYYEDFEDLTVFVEYDSVTTFKRDNIIEAEWSQSDSYSQSFPVINKPNRKYQSPGCATLAAAQIMRYYKYPKSFNWNNMPLNYATKTTCDFLYSLTSQTPHTYYDNGETGIKLSDMANTLKKYGYNANFYNKVNQNYIVIPTIMGSKFVDSDGIEQKHAWIIGGSENLRTEHLIEIWTFRTPTLFDKCFTKTIHTAYGPMFYYINWGWGPNQGNGWYRYASDMVPSGAIPGSGEMLSMITAISPK